MNQQKGPLTHRLHFKRSVEDGEYVGIVVQIFKTKEFPLFKNGNSFFF